MANSFYGTGRRKTSVARVTLTEGTGKFTFNGKAVEQYFKNKKEGFFIDVGCYHQTHRNNTFLLYKKGWQGINVDIHSFSIDLFNHLRPRDLNYNFAISDKNEILNTINLLEEKININLPFPTSQKTPAFFLITPRTNRFNLFRSTALGKFFLGTDTT